MPIALQAWKVAFRSVKNKKKVSLVGFYEDCSISYKERTILITVSEGGYLTSTIQTSKVGLVNYLENNFLGSCQCPRKQRLLKFTVLGRSETMNLKGKPPNSVKSL